MANADDVVVSMSASTVSAESPASRLQVVEDLLGKAGAEGMTWKEFDAAAGWNHHGRSTAALSGLHKTGRVARLAERRDKCSVYVLSEFTNGRETLPYGPKSTSKASVEELTQLRVRNEALFTALDNLAHAAGFRTHRHVWVEEKAKCFLCIAREVVAAEAAARKQETGVEVAPKKVVTGATIDPSRVA